MKKLGQGLQEELELGGVSRQEAGALVGLS